METFDDYIFDNYEDNEWIELTVTFSNGTTKSWLGAAMNFDSFDNKFIRIHNVQYYERSLICIPFTTVAYCQTSISEKPSYGNNLLVISNV